MPQKYYDRDADAPATAADTPTPDAATAAGSRLPDEARRQNGEAEQTEEAAQPKETMLQILRKSVEEDDPKPSTSLTFRKIIGGDILSTDVVRGQIWLFMLIVVCTVIYVAFRYQCQQDMITIDKLETELKDAKYKALSSSSTLTEKCRESHVLDFLKSRRDSLLHPSDQPPYIINVPEE